MTASVGAGDAEATRCAVCGSRAVRRPLGPVRDYVTGMGFDLLRCGACGFAATRPVPASLDRHYPERYRRFGFLARTTLRALYRRRVRAWIARVGRAGKVLEIGCGDGGMLRALASAGWTVIGSERSVGSARTAAETNGIPMFVGDLRAIAPGPQFDLIVMFHVLEHIADPVGMLRDCAGLLRPGGRIVVSVPNLASWQSRVFGRDWFHLDVPRHLGHFTPGSLERALGAVGLKTTTVSFESFEHDPYGFVQSAENRLGLPQNALTKLLMGFSDARRSPAIAAAALVLAVPLAIIGLLVAPLSWISSAGAIMEVWAVKAP